MNAPASQGSDGLSVEQLRAELQAAQRARQQLERQLAAARTGLEDFSYSVSHDLRAKLRHITAYLGLLREEFGGALPADAAGYLDTASQAAQGLSRQIDALMSLSKLDRSPLEAAVLDPNELITQLHAALAEQTADRQIQWQVARDFPALRVDALMLRQLLEHLLSNALKFTRPRAVAQIELGWQAASEGGSCTLFVRDNGVGFNPRQQERLFRVFQRLHSEAEFEGLGLGLALARRIVERHGGGIRAEGAPDAGCCISFSLPLAQA
jgi:light-regulated signal transduction histidine kinase (bacteriophytochrome)